MASELSVEFPRQYAAQPDEHMLNSSKPCPSEIVMSELAKIQEIVKCLGSDLASKTTGVRIANPIPADAGGKVPRRENDLPPLFNDIITTVKAIRADLGYMQDLVKEITI